MKTISVVIPSCNEESVIDIPIKRTQEAFERYGYSGEILIMDSSTDDTPNIAKKLGCRVISTPKQGLGKAYIEAQKYVTGDYIIMGDADGTYDYMEMNRFIEKLDSGYDFVMGSRLKGTIHPNAMPFAHRHIGTPILTAFINLFYKTRISDCNSGLRALTKEAYKKIDLISWGWEYASEMVIKAKISGLKITEVPVSLWPDTRGRTSQLSPLRAGYTNLRLIFLLVSDKLFIRLGILGVVLGSLILLSQLFGAIHFQGMMFGMYYLFLGLILSFVGFAFFQIGVLTQYFSFLNVFRQSKLTTWLGNSFSFEKGILVSLGLFGLGFSIIVWAFMNWYQTRIISETEVKLGLYSLYFLSLSIQVILFSFTFYLFDLTKTHLAK